MVITHHGGQCFKVSLGDLTIAFDPPSKDAKKLKINKFGADVVFISKNHPDMNGVEQIKDAFVINGPGEYEIKGIRAQGFLVPSKYGGEGHATAYIVEMEGMSLLFMGPIFDSTIPNDLKEALEDVDILFVPIGGGDVLSASEAHKLAVKLEARVVIPMHFDGIGDKAALAEFLETAGSDAKAEDKATLKPSDVRSQSGGIIVLKSV